MKICEDHAYIDLDGGDCPHCRTSVREHDCPTRPLDLLVRRLARKCKFLFIRRYAIETKGLNNAEPGAIVPAKMLFEWQAMPPGYRWL